jgi:hypothetical protein
MAKPKKDPIREDRIDNEAIVERLRTGGAGPGLVLLPAGQNPLPVPGKVYHDQSRFAAPQR